MSKAIVTGVILLSFLLPSCKKNQSSDENPGNTATIVVRFDNRVDSMPLLLDTLIFMNASGNLYKVTDLQYFISGFRFRGKNGSWYTVQQDEGIHYVDERLTETKIWIINTALPTMEIDSVSFTFGMDSLDNRSFRFPNPPERDMNWPEILGGGYHYMKMNLMWKNEGMEKTNPFNFHLGIGQIYKGGVINVDSITAYVQNYFHVTFPVSSFKLAPGSVFSFAVSMNINRWFEGDNLFDFSAFKNMMMQNQDAMSKACRNGREAFSIRLTRGGEVK